MHRRDFLATGAAVVMAGSGHASAATRPRDWSWVRRQFRLSPRKVHMAALLLASHPRPVREAIERYRRALDENPVACLQAENDERTENTRAAAGRYLDVEPGSIALTDSTTMGIALVYQGVPLRAGQEILTTGHDYYATHESLRLVSQRTGAQVRKIALHEGAAAASTDEIVNRIAAAITPATRVLALTWVHSGTGLKLPVRRIAEAVVQAQRDRDPADRVLVCVDGVHGFGIEDATLEGLGCDFLMAGGHKWLFGPRGTGIVCGRPEAWARLQPTIPTFIESESWSAWATGAAPPEPTTAARMTPGGFKPFEHVWALAEAFELHLAVGKARIAERTHALARQVKEGLRAMPRVTLHTPMSEDLSAGIVCFDVDGLAPRTVVERLAARGIVASTTPYAQSHARLTPCVYNTPAEVERVLREIRAIV